MVHDSSLPGGPGRASHSLTECLIELSTTWQHPYGKAAQNAAERAFVDTVACAIAAQNERAVRIVHSTLTSTSTPRIFGFPYTSNTAPQSTALLGAVAAHALDFDDVDDATISHPSAVLVPALLSLGAARGLSGKAIIDAYTCGVVAGRVLSRAIGIRDHYERGWHSTSTIGTVATAVAANRLLGFNSPASRRSLGISGSLAAGSRANFGTMTKPLHAGTAAHNAVLSSLLAEGGFTSDDTQLEAPLGFLDLHSSGDSDEAAATTETTAAADADSNIDPIGLNIKAYPCCYYTQAAADAVSDLAEAGLHAEDVAAIEVCVQPGGLSPLIHHRPVTGTQGKFSMEYVVAAMLLDGALTPQSFTDESVNRNAAQDLIPRVASTTNETPPLGDAAWTDGYAVVSVTLKTGESRSQRVDRPRGHVSRPLDEDRLRAKFDSCLAFGGLAASDSAYEGLRNLSAQKSVRLFVNDFEAALQSTERVTS